MTTTPTPEFDQIYPRLVDGRWVASPLAHIAIYAARAERDRETHAAVPRELLRRIATWRECGARRTFAYDEDGPLREPAVATCRNEQGHDKEGLPDHVRQHSNGYYAWSAGSGAES